MLTQSVSQLMNYEAVCRAGPWLRPGLLNKLYAEHLFLENLGGLSPDILFPSPVSQLLSPEVCSAHGPPCQRSYEGVGFGHPFPVSPKPVGLDERIEWSTPLLRSSVTVLL